MLDARRLSSLYMLTMDVCPGGPRICPTPRDVCASSCVPGVFGCAQPLGTMELMNCVLYLKGAMVEMLLWGASDVSTPRDVHLNGKYGVSHVDVLTPGDFDCKHGCQSARTHFQRRGSV